MKGILLPLLEEYEKILTEQVEAEAREKALTVVGEEARLLRCQLRERLLSIESEVQWRIEAFLAEARKHVFQQIRDETDAILEDLDVRLRDSLGGEPLPKRWQEPSAQGEAVDELRQPVAEEPQQEQPSLSEEPQAEQPASLIEEPETYPCEISLQVEPPLSILSLMNLFRCLWQMHGVSVVQALGLADKGATLELRLTEPTALQKLLSGIPGIKDIQDTFPDVAGNGRRTIHVALRPPKRYEDGQE